MNIAKFVLPLILTAGTAAYAQTGNGTTGTLHYNILEFQEQASVSIANDTLYATLIVRSQAPSRDNARNTASSHLNALQQRIRRENTIQAEWGNRRLYPQYNTQNRISQWEDVSEIRLNSRDFAAMSQLLNDVQAHASLDSLHFGISPAARQKAIEQASNQVLQTVRQRATFLSQQMGFTGYRIVSLELNDGFAAPPMAMASYARTEHQAKDASMQIDANLAGKQEISQTVRVRVQMQ